MGGVLDSKLRGLGSRPGLINVLHSQAKHFNPLHPIISMHILYTGLYQEFLQLIIISFILVTLMFGSGMILKGENRCWSLLGLKRLQSLSPPRNMYKWLLLNSQGSVMKC